MKILLFAIVPQNLENVRGGAEAATLNLLEGFKGKNIEVLVYSLSKNRNESVNFSSNIVIQYVGIKSFLLEYLFFGRNRLIKNVNKFHPDLIHVEGNGPYLNILRKIKNIPVVVTPHAIFSEEIKYQKRLLGRLKFQFKLIAEQWLLPKFRNIIFISNYNMDYCLKNRLFAGNSFALIRNPVYSIYFELELLPHFNNTLIYVGAITRRKNILELLQVLVELRDDGSTIKLNVCGGFTEAEYANEVREFISKNHLSGLVTFHGFLSPAKVVEVYRTSSVMVLPSMQETLPISISESLACGRPVIASSAGGVSELIMHGENGFIYPVGDSEALKGYLDLFFQQEISYADMANSAKAFGYENLHSSSIADETISFYSKVMKTNTL